MKKIKRIFIFMVISILMMVSFTGCKKMTDEEKKQCVTITWNNSVINFNTKYYGSIYVRIWLENGERRYYIDKSFELSDNIKDSSRKVEILLDKTTTKITSVEVISFEAKSVILELLLIMSIFLLIIALIMIVLKIIIPD